MQKCVTNSQKTLFSEKELYTNNFSAPLLAYSSIPIILNHCETAFSPLYSPTPWYIFFLRNMLRAGDILYVDELGSLGGTLEEIADEWCSLTALQVDVAALAPAVQLDSRRFNFTYSILRKLIV